MTVADRRAQAHLNKIHNIAGREVTLRAFLEELAQHPMATIEYYHGWGKKVQGERRPTKPKWYATCNDMVWTDIGLIGAEYLNSLLVSPVDLGAVKAQGDAQYEKDCQL